MLREVRARLPSEDLVYLADQAHVPYGDRSSDDLRGLLAANVAFLEAEGVEAIVMGCNTSCSIAARYGWPPTRLPILDLIEATAVELERSGARRIGVVATAATANSGAYGDAIRRRMPPAHVQEVAAPALVPLVEAGTLDGDEPRQAVLEACAAFEGPLDALVLACTHYPLLDAHFAAAFGPSVARIDPARAQADCAAGFVSGRNGANRPARAGSVRFYSTGDRERFVAALRSLGALRPNDTVETASQILSAQR